MRVLVVGAGIAGLACARALRLADIDCDVVERESDWVRDGTGIYLPANAIRALRMLGLEALPRDWGIIIARQRVLDHRGRLLTDVDLRTIWGTVDPCIAAPRIVLHEILRAGLQDQVRMGMTISAFRDLGERVEASFNDGTARSYDLVVAADGIHSGTRRLVLGATEERVVRPVGQLAWRFVTACPSQVRTWSVMLGRRSTFLTIPIGSGQVYCYADVTVDADITAAGAEPGDLGTQFAAYAQPVGEILASLDHGSVHSSIIEEVTLTDWLCGRVLLVGDAAHATSPNMAQGAAMALEDGLVLARCLRDGRRRYRARAVPTRAAPANRLGARTDPPA